MNYKLLIPLTVSFGIFIVGFGMAFSENLLVNDIGLWIRFGGAFLMMISAILIAVDSYKKKKEKKNDSQSESSGHNSNDENKDD